MEIQKCCHTSSLDSQVHITSSPFIQNYKYVSIFNSYDKKRKMHKEKCEIPEVQGGNFMTPLNNQQ